MVSKHSIDEFGLHPLHLYNCPQPLSLGMKSTMLYLRETGADRRQAADCCVSSRGHRSARIDVPASLYATAMTSAFTTRYRHLKSTSVPRITDARHITRVRSRGGPVGCGVRTAWVRGVLPAYCSAAERTLRSITLDGNLSLFPF